MGWIGPVYVGGLRTRERRSSERKGGGMVGRKLWRAGDSLNLDRGHVSFEDGLLFTGLFLSFFFWLIN